MSTVVAIGSVGLAQAIEREHEAAIGAARACLEHAIRCGELLIRAKAGVPHGRWRLWVEANLSFGARQAQKYMRLAARGEQMRIANSHFTIDAALAALAEPQTEQVASHTLRVMTSSESSEWYTPPHIVDLVEATLGEIDLDPCGHPDSPVRATTTYTAADDGLARPWSGRLYLNPPYGRQIDGWIDKLVAEYDSGSVTEAIALVPARTDTAWFRRLDRFPICFVYGRLSFSGMEGGALFPSAIVYLGRNTRYFAKIFCHVGGIWVRFDGDVPGAPQSRCSAAAGSTASLHRARGGGRGSAPTGDVGLCSGKT
jgi:hypothetical protein